MLKNRHISCFPILMLLVLTLQAACTGSPKKVIYTPEEFRSEVNRLVGEDHPPLQIRYDEFLDAGMESYTLDVDLLRPPFQMDAGSREQILHCVGFTGSETVRLMQLRDCVINRPSRISYNGTLTLDATGCLKLREGNCFALTNLFIGAARDAGLSSYYVMVEDVITNQTAGQQVFHINHIVSGVIVNSGHRMVDFIPDPREYHVRTTLSDIEAAGLYYNNLGANLMISEDFEGAEYLLNVAGKLYPGSYQVQNNLGLLHRRRGDVEKAQLAFEKAFSLARFPDLVMGNLLNLYRETGQAGRVEDLWAQLGRVSRRNPYLYIAMARESYQRQEYQEALDHLTSARRINRDIPEIYVLESDIWELLENPRRQKRAQKRLARLLELDAAAGADDAAPGVTPTVSG